MPTSLPRALRAESATTGKPPASRRGSERSAAGGKAAVLASVTTQNSA